MPKHGCQEISLVFSFHHPSFFVPLFITPSIRRLSGPDAMTSGTQPDAPALPASWILSRFIERCAVAEIHLDSAKTAPAATQGQPARQTTGKCSLSIGAPIARFTSSKGGDI